MTCKSSGEEVTSVVFTKFSTPTALDNNYRAAVTTAGVPGDSGDCRSGDRADTGYRSESEQAQGEVQR